MGIMGFMGIIGSMGIMGFMGSFGMAFTIRRRPQNYFSGMSGFSGLMKEKRMALTTSMAAII